MVGDKQDMVARLKAVLPAPWFADTAPVLDGLLAGLAEAWSWVYGLLESVRLQARIATASGEWLDRVALDLFGQRLRRGVAEEDGELRTRLQREMRRERGTRAAIVGKLTELTGRPPTILEPARATDTGGWGCAVAWGTAGAWGSLLMPQQCFVTAYRPEAGRMSAPIGDAEIRAAVVDMLPIASIAWLKISD